MASHQARAVAALPRAAATMAGGGRGGSQVAALREVYRMLVQPRVEYYNGGGWGGGGGDGGQRLFRDRRHKLRVATGWDGRRHVGCGTRRHFQTAATTPPPSLEQNLPSEAPPGTLPSDRDSLIPGVTTASHASLLKPSVARASQLAPPSPPPPGFQSNFLASSTVGVAPQAAAMAESIGAPRVKQLKQPQQPPASTNDRGSSSHADAFPLDTELHRELGAAIAAATPAGAVHPHVDADAEETLRPGTSTGAPDFDDAAASYTSFTNMELIRAYFVLRACAIRPLVENSEALLKLGYGVVGETLTNFVLGKTFFAHFCAGETAEQVGRRAGELQKVGIGGILDYAAEVDLRPAEERAEREAEKRAAGDDKLLLVEPAECRTYDYMGEAACDARMMTFLACVRAVRDQTPGGFSAVKLTALGDPVLLSQLSTCVHLVRGLFEDFDGNRDGVVSHAEFEEGYRRWFRSEAEEDRATLARTMKHLDLKNTGGIDYVEWSNRMRLDNLADITANCRNRGPLAAAALGGDGVALKDAMQRRIGTLAKAAAAAEVRLMIDAEQSWLQPAIDNTVYSLQCEFNKDFPTIFTTYQCYLKDSLERLEMDLDRASRGGYVWAGKLVRGAYMVSEREKAEEDGYESPVFETIEETHANYDAAITMVLEHKAAGNSAEVMIATHNQASIEHTISLMRKLGIRRRDGVSFGQLLGMADNITFPLGTGGYKAYKYIPYGKVGETIPYLLRRAQENSSMLSGAKHERGLLVKEIVRRVLG